jgi:hypothetical protein
MDTSTLLTGANCGRKHLTERWKLWTKAPYWQVQIVDPSTLLPGANCGCKRLTDRCKLWTTAPYQQVHVVETSFILTGASCEHKHLIDRCKLWTQWQVPVVAEASYWQVQVVDACQQIRECHSFVQVVWAGAHNRSSSSPPSAYAHALWKHFS